MTCPDTLASIMTIKTVEFFTLNTPQPLARSLTSSSAIGWLSLGAGAANRSKLRALPAAVLTRGTFTIRMADYGVVAVT